ncbi:MAG: helix-turn-helix domain-containing protein, partial [Actinobacteria bacterium]|nr:helix-turn-helix domain-containing protein [Actinomycetota bacterium]
MSTPPRRLGRPLDLEAATSRAHQISALADPLRLQVLSAIASAEDQERTVSATAATLGSEVETVDLAIDALRAAGLVSIDERGAFQLTADAWVRFGRLIAVGMSSTIPASPNRPPRPQIDLDLPPVAARIAQD